MPKSRTTIKGHEGTARLKESYSDSLSADTYWYAVTSVTSGTEDACDTAKADSVVLTETGSAMLCWDAVSGASEYRIYRMLTAPSVAGDFDGSRLTTIPAGAEYPYFIDDGSYSVGSGSQGSGSNTPTIYGHKDRPQTRIPTTLTEFAFQEISFENDEAYSAHPHGGVRTKTHKEGSIEIKGSIKRLMTDGYFKGACAGFDRAGTTNTGISYANEVIGNGIGYYDGTEYTVSNCEQSPISRRKPTFKMTATLNPDDSTPIVFTFTEMKLYDWKSGISADKELTEQMSFSAEASWTQYDASKSFS